MALHPTNAQIQTILAKTGSNMKPGDIAALTDALSRTDNAYGTDGGGSSTESTLGTIFPSGSQQW